MSSQNIRKNQQGFVAIIASLTIITILAVITTSFARLMLREQRQALDYQLNTQAFYAAESGVNYAIKKKITDKTTCPTPGADPLDNPTEGVVNFTCLLVDSEPQELLFDDVNTERPTIFNLTTTVNRLDIAWQSADRLITNFGNAAAGVPFTDASSWGNRVGVVEMIVYPVSGGTADSTALMNNSRTFYLYPSSGSGTATASYANNAQVVQGRCAVDNLPKHCKVAITNVPAAQGYVVRLRAIYNNVSLQMNGFTGGGSGTAVELTGAQRIIDVTGKANDVLSRIQVRLPITPGFDHPMHALEANSICKLLRTEPNATATSCPAPITQNVGVPASPPPPPSPPPPSIPPPSPIRYRFEAEDLMYSSNSNVTVRNEASSSGGQHLRWSNPPGITSQGSMYDYIAPATTITRIDIRARKCTSSNVSMRSIVITPPTTYDSIADRTVNNSAWRTYSFNTNWPAGQNKYFMSTRNDTNSKCLEIDYIELVQ